MALKFEEIKPEYNIVDETESKNSESQKKKNKSTISKIFDYINEYYDLRFNVITLSLEYRDKRGKLAQKKFKEFDERKLNTIWIDLQEKGIKCPQKTLLNILNSEYTKSRNPIKEYFDQLQTWDGIDYIKQLSETIVISDTQIDDLNLKDFWYTYLKKWLIASAYCALGKGANHTCLILSGGQGKGKTTWLNKLCPSEMKDFIVTGHINPSLTDKNTANYLAEKWFVNIDDQLDSIIKKDHTSMKALMTLDNVTSRKVFHRLAKIRIRIASFIGSVNSRDFLTDKQNRRYIVFSVDEIDYKHTIDMNLVWSQALHFVNTGFNHWFSSAELEQLNKLNDIFHLSSPEEEWLQKLFEPCEAADPKAQFMMPSEMLSMINAQSGLRMSMKRLSQAIEKCNFGTPISKRFPNKGSRKVYPVRMITSEKEMSLQNEIRREQKALKEQQEEEARKSQEKEHKMKNPEIPLED